VTGRARRRLVGGPARWRERLGTGPVGLLALLAGFAIAGAAVVGWTQRPRDLASVLIWFTGAIVLHDLVLLPVYSLLDRLTVGRLARGGRRRTPGGDKSAAAYVRVPLALSALLFAVFFPVILGLGARSELIASGIPERGYLVRWLALSGALFALSAAAYVVSRARHRGPGAT
jgi:hypothetical protein